MFKKITLSDELTFYQNDNLNVFMGDDEKQVNLGLMVEILDIVGATGEGDENYPYVVSFGLMTSRPHESFYEGQAGDEVTQEALLYDCNGYMGSVPVDHILVNAVNAGLDEVKKLFTIDEAKVVTKKPRFGTVAAQHGPGATFSYLMFANEEAAQKYVDFIIENRAQALTMMIGFILDRPINMIGDTGWSSIETMVEGSRYNRKEA